MFIANLTYVKPLADVEKCLEDHNSFLDKYYNSGKIVCSGRKNPRTGGIILINAKDNNEIEQIFLEDPFNVNKVANYEIIEFVPTKCAPNFKCLVD